MNPTVPKTRSGGYAVTGSIPALPNALYATELDIAMVGI